MGDRTATSSTWKNTDGSITIRNYSTAQFYKPTATAGWAPIDTSLRAVAGRAGRWRSGANSWQAVFGSAGASGGAEQITVGGSAIAFTPVGVTSTGLVPSVSGSTATYPDLWPQVTLVDRVTSGSVVEDLVLAGPSAPASYTFTVSGATARTNASGGLDVVAAGKTIGVVPALTVSLARPATAGGPSIGAGSPQMLVKASGAKLAVHGSAVSVSVSASWLASLPASAFPVVIDPSFTPTGDVATPDQAFSFSSAGGSLSKEVAIGQDSAGDQWDGAAYVPFVQPPAPAAGQQPFEPTSAFVFAGCETSLPGPMSGDFVYGESAQPTSYSSVTAGQLLYKNVSNASELVIKADLQSWLGSHPTGSWFGFGETSTATQVVFPASAICASILYYQEPPASALVTPVTGSVATPTPTLTATTTDPDICSYTDEPTPPSGVACDQPQEVLYDFRVSTSPLWNAGQTVADSGWIPQPYTLGGTDTVNGYPITVSDPSWTVPAGALSDGVTYYVTVQDADSNQNPEAAPPFIANNPTIIPPALALPAVSMTVKQRLGAGGPSPTDTIGSPPGQTSTPSAGAPSPGTPPSSETVDLVTGNLALAVGTPSMSTLAGPAGVTLTYNSGQSSTSSGSNFGLNAAYYADSGTHTFPATAVGTQVDPSIDVTTDQGTPPVGGIEPFSPYLARWTGTITLPTSLTGQTQSWELGGVASGGLRVFIAAWGTTPTTLVYDDWSGGVSGLAFGSGSALVSGRYSIEVDGWDPGVDTTLQLWANNVSVSSSPVPNVVQSSWLMPGVSGLPPGWSMSSMAAAWTSVTDDGSQVVAHSASGATETFTYSDAGSDPEDGFNTTTFGYYIPQRGSTDALAEVGGQLQLSTNSGYLYRFSAAGLLVSVATVADDRHPAALQYTYGPASSAAGAPVVLQAITDPVSGRSVTASYGTAASCAVTNPVGYLCGINGWDGTSTSLIYNSNGELAEVDSPGGSTTLFGYDSNGRLDDIRDALANDYVISDAPQAPACPTVTQTCPADTWISYDSSGRVSTVSEPRIVGAAPRAQRAYTYVPSTTTPGAGSTQVTIAGFNPPGAGGSPAGVAETVAYDSQSRVVSQTNSAGLTSHTVWDNEDRPIISVDAAGEQTSSVYDFGSNLTDSYGPAPVACFDPTTVPTGVTIATPVVGYLPVANPTGTTGCGVAVPHTHTGYDQGITGLADTYWSNGQYAGAAAAHATGNLGTPTNTCVGYQPAGTSSATDLCGSWPAGSTPPGVTVDGGNQWSMKLTGTITLPSSGEWTFCVYDHQDYNLFFDSTLAGTDFPYGEFDGSTFDCYSVTLTTGQHTIELDVVGSPAQVTSYNVFSEAPNTCCQATEMPMSILDPAYGLATSSTDADGKTTSTAYSDGVVGAEDGLPTATTVDPTGLALTTTTTYESPGAAGTFLRRLSTTLPAGTTTTYTYYTGTGGPIAAACGVTSSTTQGGELETQTDPAPSPGSAAREQQFIYDATGRQAGRRVGPSNTINSANWQCTSYDARGRITSQAWPATATAPARTVTYTYAIGGNPLVSGVTDTSDPGGTITSTVDLLGRVVSYTDANNQTTTTTYDQAGRVTGTSGPQGDILDTYDPTSSQLVTVTDSGTLLAAASYTASTGRLSTVAYSNGTTGTLGYDTYGNQNSLVFTSTATGALVAGDQVTRSTAGRIVSELEDINGTSLTNPNPAGSSSVDYTYDGTGRLATAALPGASATYSYATNVVGDGCADPGEGANTNLTSVSTTPAGGSATTLDSCYNSADQLTATITGGTTTTAYSYDGDGNDTVDNGTTLTWDAADRLASTTKSGVTTTYTYDALDRLIARTTGGVETGYAYAGFGDTPAATLNVTPPGTTVQQGFVGLPGGVTVTTQASNIWSYPDLHGNITVTTDNTGIRQGSIDTYDPWGNLTTGDTPANNATGGANLGAFGAAGKLTDTTTNITLLGARAYNAAQNRFLSVDPIQGGCADAYVYVYGDPLNQQDLTGQGDNLGPGEGAASHACPAPRKKRKSLLSLFGEVVAGVSTVVGAIALAVPEADALAATALTLGAIGTAIDVKSCISDHDAVACATAALGLTGIGGGLVGIGKFGPEAAKDALTSGKALLIGGGLVAGPSASAVDATIYFAPTVPCGA